MTRRHDLPSDWNPADPGLSVPERLAQMADVRAKCPVAYTTHLGGMWSIMRYQDIVNVAAAPAIFSNGANPRWGVRLPPLEVDPPQHHVYRRMMAKFFTPTRIQRLEPRLRAAAIELMAPAIARGHGDLAREIAYPLPVLGLCALMDFPKDDWVRIKTWAETTLLMDSDSEDERATALRDHHAILDYARDIVALRQKHPRDPDDDMTSAILATEVDGVQVDPETCAGMLRLVISAGHNSTTSAIGNAFLHLAQTREDQQILRADPSKIPAAIEEFLRFDTPVQEMPRYATQDVELCGRHIKSGERIGMFWASANRDDEVFSDPDRCIIDRKPNRHVAFGSGVHSCIGAPMARMEIRVAIEELLARTTSFAINGEVVRPRYHRMGVTALPVAIAA